MVAAATTSLPERAEAGRNYDYRYVWIRDQCYAGQAVAAAGPHPLLDDAVALRRRPAAGPRGPAAPRLHDHRWAAVPDQRTLNLPGYPGGHDHDRELGQPAIPARRVRRGAAAVRRRRPARPPGHRPLARRRSRRRPPSPPDGTEPDAGIWEIDNQALDPQPADLRRRAPRLRRRRTRRRHRRRLAHPGRPDRRRHRRDTPPTPPAGGNALPPTRTWTRRCCSLRCAAPSPPTTPAPPRP